MASIQDIRRRIRSVKSTGKITRAMEMISSVKMRKASERVLRLREYAKGVAALFDVVSRSSDVRAHIPLFVERPIRTALFVVITSNRGLCGSFNAETIRRVRRESTEFLKENPGASIQFLSLGKKGDARLRFLSGTIIASFPDIVAVPSAEGARTVARFAIDGFLSGSWDEVRIFYTDYVSALLQKSRMRRMLPVFQQDVEEQLGDINPEDTSLTRLRAEYLIEPNPETVLRELVARLVEAEVLHALLESNASEEAARMAAMHNATDAAKEMESDFTLTYNQLRQQKVTQEIAELSAGMAAVS